MEPSAFAPAPPPDGTPGLRIGRFAGAPVVIRWEAFLILPLFTLGGLMHGGLPLAGLVLTAMVLSILAHECAHAVAVRRARHRVLSIEVTAFGGLCWFDDDGLSRRQRCAIYAAGPLANLALAALLIAVATARGLDPSDTPMLADAALSSAAIMNLAFGLFNLVPAFPLDGGLLAMTLLEPRIGTRPAVLAISGFGLAAAVPVYFFGLAMMLLGSPFIVMLSFKRNRLVFGAAWGEWRAERRVRRGEAARHRAALAGSDAQLSAIVARSGRKGR